MSKQRVFNVGDEVVIRSREYGYREWQDHRGIIDQIYDRGREMKYRYIVKDTEGEHFELCTAEMKKVASSPELTVMEDWS